MKKAVFPKSDPESFRESEEESPKNHLSFRGKWSVAERREIPRERPMLQGDSSPPTHIPARCGSE